MSSVPFDGTQIKALSMHLIEELGLDLAGAAVLTEAASGPYVVTPLLAALAGAQVEAITRDSRYGKADDVISFTKKLAIELGVLDLIRFHIQLTKDVVASADIVTNLGFVRPIDRVMIENLKSSAVVPLMWEPWEFRAGDLDLDACRARGIPVYGTDEQDPRVRTFDYLPELAMKLLGESDVAVSGSEVAVIGSGIFASKVLAGLEGAGANSVHIDLDKATWREAMIPDSVSAVLVIEHHRNVEVIGSEGVMSGRSEFWREKRVIHICGAMDGVWVRERGASLYPNAPEQFGRMSFTTAHIGCEPVVRLHAAGLKVGEAMWRGVVNGFKGKKFNYYVCDRSPAKPLQ